MRALITLIAILTVGMVTAQDDPATYQGYIPYSSNAQTITVSGTTYELTSDLEAELNGVYPNGTNAAYEYKKDIYDIDNNLVGISFAPASGVSGNGEQGYRLLFTMHGGDRWGFFSDIPDEAFSGGEFTATISGRRDNEGGWDTQRDGYSTTTTLTISPAGIDAIGGRITVGINLPDGDEIIYTFSFPVRTGNNGLTQEIVDTPNGRYISTRQGNLQESLQVPFVPVITKFVNRVNAGDIASWPDLIVNYTINHTLP